MTRNPRQVRPLTGRWRPRLEGLELRHLLSGPTAILPGAAPAIPAVPSMAPSSSSSGLLSVVGVSPSPGAALTTSPQSIALTFNQPYLSWSLKNDLQIERVAADGTATPLSPQTLTERRSLAPATDVLTASVNVPLSPGHYRVVILGDRSHLQAADGAPLAYSSQVALGDFTVASSGVTLADASPLGTIGPEETVQAGSLDLAANPEAVALYQFTLPEGHFWRLGAEISATRDGGSLASALALFDSSGHPIATSEIGRSDYPEDPYLFDGLAPGTYYIGVSGRGNLPGPGGYDLSTGIAGTGGQSQPGGPFRLHLLADAEDTPTTVQGFSLSWANPLDPSPTGFTLDFSGPMNEQSLQGEPFRNLQVVDESGASWSLVPSGLDESASAFSYAFDEHLPAGTYTLRIPAGGGISDLAGLAPVTPGEPQGVLATWTVAPAQSAPGPNDLGTLFPPSGAPDDTAPHSLSAVVTVGAGGSLTEHFAVAAGGEYVLRAGSEGVGPSLVLNGPGGVRHLDPPPGGGSQVDLVSLQPGAYSLEIDAPSDAAVRVSLGLDLANPGSLLANGVGQGPALNLTLIAPAAPQPTAAPTASGLAYGPPGQVGSASSTATPASPGPGSSASANPSATIPQGTSGAALGAPAAPAGLVLVLGGTPIGRPTPDSERISAVGPGATGGATTLASSVGLLQGISYGPRLGEGGVPVNDASALNGEGEGEAATGGTAMAPSPAPATPPDELALISVDWIDRLGPSLSSWLLAAGRPDDAGAPALGIRSAAVADRIVMGRDDLRPDSGRIERASLQLPLGLGLAALVVLRYQQPFRQWLAARAERRWESRPRPEPRRALGKGPHVPLRSPGVTVPTA